MEKTKAQIEVDVNGPQPIWYVYVKDVDYPLVWKKESLFGSKEQAKTYCEKLNYDYEVWS